MRRLVADHVRERGWSMEAVDEITLAVGEACNNAVNYGMGGGETGWVTVSWGLSEGERLTVEVRNRGGDFCPDLGELARLPEDDATHGRGFFLMEALVDEVWVWSEDDETVVRLVKTRNR
jgi:serine/threonine-protein kinase RsbW